MSNTEQLPMVLTPKEVASVLGISRNTAYQLMHSDNFPAFRVGKMLRVSREHFISWLDTVSKSNAA